MLRFASPKQLLSSLSPAYAAALALVCIQVGIGIMYKAAQSGGKYPFSATASVTISETLKCLLSTFLFYREWKNREGGVRLPQTPIPSQPVTLRDMEEGKEKDDDDSDTLSISDDDPLHHMEKSYQHSQGTYAAFFEAVKEEIPQEIKFGFAHLALFYVLINNIVFVLFRLADPGTIQLIKSGTTLITAVVMILFLKTKIGRGQWIAIVFQVCGIVVTQYTPSGSAFPLSTYLILIFQTTLSAVSSVYNQKLCKSSDGSLHVMNMTLYSCGAVINFILHILVRIMNRDEPGFFTGWGHIGALMVIVSNVFIGLAMTAVYKYADALIKCFATAMSTAILLYLSPLLFNVSFSFLVIPGTLVVFMATWLYMESTPSKPANPTPEMKPASMEAETKSFVSRILYSLSPYGPFRKAGLMGSTSICFLIIGMVTFYRTHYIITEPTVEIDLPTNITMPPSNAIYDSPMRNVAGFIRINHDLPERVEQLTAGYEPFFDSLHFSMPAEGHDRNETNLERDYWNDSYWPYPAMVDYLQLVLNNDAEYGHLEGVLFFHFDAWIAPLSFNDMDFTKLWVLDKSTGPPYICQTELKRMADWMWFDAGWQEKSLQATRIIDHMYSGYTFNPEEFCAGWSDMYYLPRRFFQDFINLGGVMTSVQVFHEIAVPTIWNIIDKTYSLHASQSVLHRWGDCWGDCCAGSPLVEDIAEHRCGHHVDFLNWEITSTHFDRLERDAQLIGTEIPVREVRQTAKGPVFVEADRVVVSDAEVVARFMMM
ncbi:hypothetical protein BT63DRAFT_425654 [Microthyrium microscopicum]|uniref:UDP-galactose transporter n=1 Tax=Microthyrium microscopicum TaxID=703497 RepID=A0A6A6UBM9_9PEZI|nr:hypothetical protein BT63DRAFT_425654 [Microthyrium microscopicum]